MVVFILVKLWERFMYLVFISGLLVIAFIGFTGTVTLRQVVGSVGVVVGASVLGLLIRARRAVRIEEPPADGVLWLSDERSKNGDG